MFICTLKAEGDGNFVKCFVYLTWKEVLVVDVRYCISVALSHFSMEVDDINHALVLFNLIMIDYR